MQDLQNIEDKVKKIPTDFAPLSDSEFITKMREINEFIHLLEGMATPTQPIAQKRDNSLRQLREIVEKNRDKLFTKREDGNDPTQSSDVEEVVEAEYVEPTN